MAEHLNLNILYTPVIPYAIDLETGITGSFNETLVPIVDDYSQNHIPYLKKSKVDKRIIFDEIGKEKAIEYAMQDMKLAKRIRGKSNVSLLTLLQFTPLKLSADELTLYIS